MLKRLRGLRKGKKEKNKQKEEQNEEEPRREPAQPQRLDGRTAADKSEAELALEFAIASRQMIKGGEDRRGSMAESLAELKRRAAGGPAASIRAGQASVMDMPDMMGASDANECKDVDEIQQRVSEAVSQREADDHALAERLQKVLNEEFIASTQEEHDAMLALSLAREEAAMAAGVAGDADARAGAIAPDEAGAAAAAPSEGGSEATPPVMAFPADDQSGIEQDAMVVESIRLELREIAEDIRFVESPDCPLGEDERKAITSQLRKRQNDLMGALPSELRLIMTEVLGAARQSAAPRADMSQEESDFYMALRMQAEESNRM